jgi:hypothetical protein
MDDELLRALGRHQRDELDAPEGEVEGDDAMRPFDDAERERMLDAVFLGVAAGEATQPVSVAANDPPAGAQVISLNRRRTAVLGLLLASAAALSLVIWWSASRDPAGHQDAVAMLPEYATSELRGGRAAQRSAPDEQAGLTLAPTDEIDWTVTPAEPVGSRPGVVLLAEDEADRALFVPDTGARITDSGAIRLRAPLERLFGSQADRLEPGEWTFTLLIGPAGKLPDTLEEARAEGPWQRVSVRLTLVASP